MRKVNLGLNSVDSLFDFIRDTLIPTIRWLKHKINCHNGYLFHSELLQDAGILLIFLPPYSPDYNSIKETFIKDHDKVLQTLQAPDVMAIIKAAFDTVTVQDCNSWITYA